MTKANVYKHHSIEPECEKVRIPDVDEQHPPELEESQEPLEDTPGPSEETSEVEAEREQDAPPAEPEPEPEPESEPEPEPLPVYPTGEELRELYENELAELCGAVGEQAYHDAVSRKTTELKDCIDSVKALMDEMALQQQEYMRQYTEELKYMAVDIAEKLVLEKISEDDAILQRLVLQSVNSVKNAEWLNVEVSERLVGLVDYLRKELAKPEYNGKATVFPIQGTDGLCRVTTEDGTIVCSIEAQAETLREAFRRAELL